MTWTANLVGGQRECYIMGDPLSFLTCVCLGRDMGAGSEGMCTGMMLGRA
jgi:hypothetical protein